MEQLNVCLQWPGSGALQCLYVWDWCFQIFAHSVLGKPKSSTSTKKHPLTITTDLKWSCWDCHEIHDLSTRQNTIEKIKIQFETHGLLCPIKNTSFKETLILEASLLRHVKKLWKTPSFSNHFCATPHTSGNSFLNVKLPFSGRSIFSITLTYWVPYPVICIHLQLSIRLEDKPTPKIIHRSRKLSKNWGSTIRKSTHKTKMEWNTKVFK